MNNAPECPRMLEQMDGLLQNTLPADGARELERHLAGCTACSEELATRRMIRERLQKAAHGVSIPPYLEARIRSQVAGARRSSPWMGRLMAVGVMATIVVALGASLAYRSGHFRLSKGSQESYIDSATGQVPSLMRVGLGDHIHCAVFRKYPPNPPTMDKFVAQLGPSFSGLIPVVQEHVPSEYRLILAHQCRYHNRKFVHLTLTDGSRLLSLVIATKEGGESFQAQDLAPALSESGLPMYRAGVQRFQMAAFETQRHLVYVISDLTEERNLAMMRAVAPGINALLVKLENS